MTKLKITIVTSILRKTNKNPKYIQLNGLENLKIKIFFKMTD